MTEYPASRIYLTRFHLSDGTVKDSRFTTRRQRGVGDIVNLRTASDGTSRDGKGYLWRIRAIEENEEPLIEATLVLDFERPHPDQE